MTRREALALLHEVEELAPNVAAMADVIGRSGLWRVVELEMERAARIARESPGIPEVEEAEQIRRALRSEIVTLFAPPVRDLTTMRLAYATEQYVITVGHKNFREEPCWSCMSSLVPPGSEVCPACGAFFP